MKDKLNLTINKKLIIRSKLFAKKHDKSVSQIVEELLQQKLDDEKNSFIDKWLGKLKFNSSHDARSKYLKDRYSL
jgi:hypothetical protein